MTRRPLTLNDLPLFATDEQLGEAVLGPERKGEFTGFADLCKGMPPINVFWGGRYVPAVKAFLDFDQGLRDLAPTSPHGMEGTWPTKKTDRKARV